MVKTTAIVAEEEHFILSNLSPGPAQRRLALAVVLAFLVAGFIAAGPFSGMQLARIDAFVPVYATAMLVNDSLTAVLLFAQFSILRARALLALSSGYLFMALTLVPWMLTFPGVYGPQGLLGAGLQSTAWIYVLWHVGFPMFVLLYALLKDADPAKRLWPGSVPVAISGSVVVTAMIVCVATFIVTAGDRMLPRLMIDTVHISPSFIYAAAPAILLSVIAIVVLWFRQHSILDLWLMVVMFGDIIEIYLIAFPVPVRFSVGWYAGRICGLISGSLILFIMLYEITTLYARLLGAVLAQRREREARLMTGDAVAAAIAHEVRQPLAAMITEAEAGVRWIERATPDLEEAKVAFEQIIAAGSRASSVIGSIRALFKKGELNRASLDINELVEEVLALVDAELEKHRILVDVARKTRLPPVLADRTQLQQVLLNLIANAIDSMAAKDGRRVLSVRSEARAGSEILVSVADNGPGIGSDDIERIFNPLFTTKSGGMGMGLAICRSIIENHDGRLWAAPNVPQGAVFQFTLRAAGIAPAAG